MGKSQSNFQYRTIFGVSLIAVTHNLRMFQVQKYNYGNKIEHKKRYKDYKSQLTLKYK